MKKIYYLGFIVLFGLTLASCSLAKEEKRTGEKVEITQTVTVKVERDQEGTVTKSEEEVITTKVFINPKRVASFSLGVADIFLYVGLEKLGITHFGVPKTSTVLPETLSEFNKTKYANVGDLHTPNITALELFNPELIILDGRTRTFYEQLKEKFPNADVIDLSLTTYEFEKHKENLQTLAKIFPEAKDELTEKIPLFEQKFNEIKELTEGVRLLFVQLNGTNISVATGKNGRYGLVYKEFGFTPADLQADGKAENSHGTMGANLEYIKQVNPQVIFIMDRNIIVSGEASPNFISEPLLHDVEAIINGHVYNLDPTSWYTIAGGITATEQMFNDVMQYINALNNN